MLDFRTEFETYKDCFIDVDRYVADDRICLKLWNMAEGPIATLTVCLDDHRKTTLPDETYINRYDVPEAVNFLIENGIASATGKWGWSGYGSYPALKIDVDEAMKHRYVKEAV